MPEIEFEVICEISGHGALDTSWGAIGRDGVLYVTPCDDCINEAYEEGKKEGDNA